MKRQALLCTLTLLLTPVSSLADEPTGVTTGFSYTLAELEELVDASPQIRLLTAKQEETRRRESIWHDISVSAGFNPIRTADQFTDRIRAGLAVSMPLDIRLFRDSARVSREEVSVSGIETAIASKQIDVHDIEDGMLALVGKQ